MSEQHKHTLCLHGWPEEMDCWAVAETCSCITGKPSVAGLCRKHDFTREWMKNSPCPILRQVYARSLSSEDEMTYKERALLIKNCSPDDTSDCDCAYLQKNGGLGAI